jgi:hypothetical protein
MSEFNVISASEHSGYNIFGVPLLLSFRKASLIMWRCPLTATKIVLVLSNLSHTLRAAQFENLVKSVMAKLIWPLPQRLITG